MLRALVLLLAFGCGSSSNAMKLEYYGETAVARNAQFRKTTIGGLSAIVYQGNQLWALSDDKGKFGDPRFYIFDLKIHKDDVQLKVEDMHYIHSIPAPLRGEKTVLDPEGLVILPNGDIVVSSENNNDKKPRVPPRFLLLELDGKYKSDIALPEKFIPEALGKQEKGLRNNAGFEGLTRTADAKWMFAAAELSILTDEPESEENPRGELIRILKLNDKHEVVAEFGYRIEPASRSSLGLEVFRGVSEILAINEHKLIVLERGVRLHKTGWSQTVALYIADLSAAADVSKVKNLATTPLRLVQKTKLLDLEADLQRQRPGKVLQNFEGLAWGPTLPNKKKSLLIIADNNFSKKEITELLVFSVEGE